MAPLYCNIAIIHFSDKEQDPSQPGGLLHSPLPLLRAHDLLLSRDHVARGLQGPRTHVHTQDGQTVAAHSLA